MDLDSPTRYVILRDFQNQEYRFTIPKSWTRLAEKREDEHKQLQKRYAFDTNAKIIFFVHKTNSILLQYVQTNISCKYQLKYPQLIPVPGILKRFHVNVIRVHTFSNSSFILTFTYTSLKRKI